jgi:signal transduction histidine kinase/ActR/RegA family two-component response regulator
MAEGDLDVAAPPTHSSTELGDMARALEAFRINARERLEAEAGRRAAEKTAQDRSEFLAIMSHEIRTPMNGVLGMAEALAHTPLNGAQREMLSVLTESGGALMGMLNDVLDYAKLEAGRITVERIPFELDKVVQGTVALFRPEAESKGLSVRVTCPPGAYCGDPSRIRQVLHNLLSNAVKFTHQGSVEVHAQAAVRDDGRRELRIAIRDTGIGITPEVQARLFQKFVQGDTSTTRLYGGSGLGLAISRELARLMGGDVTVSSEPGAGSSFTVSLVVEAVPAAGDTEAVAVKAAPLQRPRILVVEDDASARQVLALILEVRQAEAVFARDVADAFEHLSTQRFDFLLIAADLSGVDALEAARRIRQAPGQTLLPIIGLIPNSDPHRGRACLEAGMDAHVAKPVRAAELFAAMDELRRGRNPDAESARAAA